jgi:UDP-N-acetylmuramyl pentapeptide phosphotransferase/UDP-N-acetylglucosamine-1-phosphate transferase
MENTYIGILVFVLSLVASAAAFPRVLRFAKDHNIVDNPNARKLQRVPVPVMGGVAVYVGIMAGCIVLDILMFDKVLTWGLAAMTFMMLIGVWDDVKDISARLRLLIEIFLVLAFIFITDTYIDDFHGLWGINALPPEFGIPFSVLAGVGIINAVNLIDGVDGYSSGYGILACICFGLMSRNVWDPVIQCLTLIVIAALLPFFMHNVFGRRSKMFIGDGGTLMLGALMTVLLFYTMSSKENCYKLDSKGICLGAFSLAVLCIPVFDTLRVMSLRMMRGKSPFRPDKTHLHHLFIDMGFGHLGAGLFILMINTMVVLVWLASWKLGASIEAQLYIVIALGFAVTFGFYKLMKIQQNGGPCDEEGYPQGTRLWHLMQRVGKFSHREKGPVWRFLTHLVDSRLLGGVKK